MKKLLIPVVLFITLCLHAEVKAQTWLMNSEQWAATDALGRKLPTASEVGNEKNEKVVGMFYWTWHQAGPGDVNPHNLTELLAQYDEATVEAMMNDFDHANWNGIEQFFWDEPLFGYYRTTDEWILRKHAEMLADAQVDVVFFDCTNGSWTWKASYTKLLEVWNQARLDGVKTPQIAFLLPFGPNDYANKDIIELYYDLYQPGLYEDLWFMWEGKPLIMGYPESLVPTQGETAGLKFTATAPFYAVNATCPSWSNNIGSLTFKLFKWENSYGESVNGTPLAEETFVDFNDNAKLALPFEALPAGEYVWELSNGTEQVGVWKWTDGSNTTVSYFSGTVVSGNYESEIAYTPEINFTALTSGTTHEPVELSGLTVTENEVNTMKDFFTFRPAQPDYVTGPVRDDQWGWLEVFPQNGFPANTGDSYEQVCVSVAQNASPHSGGKCTSFNGPDTYGRNYTGAADGSTGTWDNSEDGYLKGANFQQQWERAFELDPRLVWVTGWNEWIFGRHESWEGCQGGAKVVTSFPDNFDKYRSRDIEPVKSWGNKGDVYYIQLVDYVRQFKGMQKQDMASPAKVIDINDMNSWINVQPEYHSYKGNTVHRNHRGQGESLMYTNTTGRNDITGAKVARDNDFVYFYVETDNIISAATDPKWMRLFIDIDRDKSTGWEGYDFVVNRNSPTDSVLIEKSTNSWAWVPSGKGAYTINEKSLVLKLPYSALGLSAGEQLNFEFKWSDNMQEDGNIMDFYVNGDVAPGGRFNYIYQINKTDDGYQYAKTPQGTNQGLKCEMYEESFDSIPQFNRLVPSETFYPNQIALPETVNPNFALKYSGFFEANAKEEYTFTLKADSMSRLFIDGIMLLETNNSDGEQMGTIKLMPGKHDLRIDYITGHQNSPELIVMMQSPTTDKGYIHETLLSKYNALPVIQLEFIEDQNYYIESDEIARVNAVDPDGNVAKIQIFNGQDLIAESDLEEYIIKNLDVGNYSVAAKVMDNDGASITSNILAFEVRLPFTVPGTINAYEFRKGENVTILDSKDSDGGFDIRIVYGSVDYPIQIDENGLYELSFRVPASSRPIPTKITIDGIEKDNIDLGNTGTDEPWYDVKTQIDLDAGIQVLGMDFQGVATLHKIEIIESDNLGINTSAKNSVVNVLPNPSSDNFIVRSSIPFENINIYSATGTIIENYQVDSRQISIQAGLYPSGFYFIQVNFEDGSNKVVRLVRK